jgi:hypothetical protein
MDMILTLVLVKDTGRSYKYDLQKINNPSAKLLHDSTCLYINKSAFGDQIIPQSITMKVSIGEPQIVIPG